METAGNKRKLPKGREAFTTRILGNYLQEEEDGQITLLRGKYSSCYLQDVPRGYIRKYIMTAWIEDMTDEERELFEARAKKEEDHEG
jgi:hypothetical protein